MVSTFPTAADRDAITAAVRAAEARTSSEIVVWIQRSCDEYVHAQWKAAAMGAVLAVFAGVGLRRWLDLWIGYELVWALVAGTGAALGFLLVAFLPPLRRWLATPEVMTKRARAAAAEAFLDLELWKTRERTGILLFLALAEREAVVLADSGIASKVPQDHWDDLVAELARALHARESAAPVCNAVARCGELLERAGFVRRADDENEISDAVRVEE